MVLKLLFVAKSVISGMPTIVENFCFAFIFQNLVYLKPGNHILRPLYNRYFRYVIIIQLSQNCPRTIRKYFLGDIFFVTVDTPSSFVKNLIFSPVQVNGQSDEG